MSYPVFYVPAGDVLPVMFASYAGSTGASSAMTGLAVTDIEIYKDGSVTQRSSDAGYTLLDTDGLDFDGITGINGFSIDTGDNTDASFYTVGSWFTVVVSTVTVDSQTVSFIACQFRIMKAEAVAGVPKGDVDAWLGTAAATPTVAGVPEVDVTHYGGSAGTFASGVPAVNAAQISGDSTAADNLESEYDGTGYGQVLQRTTIATLAGQTSFTLTAGSADDNAYNGCIIVIQDASTAAQKAVGVISDYTGSTKTVTLLTDPGIFTMATTDIVTIIADRALKPTVDNRTLDVDANGGAEVGALNSDGQAAVADAILKRDWTSVSGEASRSVLNALRFLRNKFTISGGTMTVYEEDDTTSAWTSALSTTAGDPVSESDPS